MEQCDNVSFLKATLFKKKKKSSACKILRHTIEITVLQSALHPDGIVFFSFSELHVEVDKYTLGYYLQSVHCFMSRGSCVDFTFQNGKELKTFVGDFSSRKHLYWLSCKISWYFVILGVMLLR